MGTFAGHIDEAIFFVGLSFWWLYCMYRDYIKVGCDGDKHRSQMSYPVCICGRNIPVEIIIKTLFPIAGFLAEIYGDDAHIICEDGGFCKLAQIQHMTIYGMFILHGVMDMLTFFNVPLIPGSNYVTASMAFIWYGVEFYFHSTLHGGTVPLEQVIHMLSIPFMIAVGVVGLLEYFQCKQTGIWPQMTRTYFVLILGTWYTQASYVLYDVSKGFMTGSANPLWDRRDHRNVTFMVIALGMHLVGNFIFMYVVFLFMYAVHRIRTSGIHSIKLKTTIWRQKPHEDPVLENGKILSSEGYESVKLLSGDDDFDY